MIYESLMIFACITVAIQGFGSHKSTKKDRTEKQINSSTKDPTVFNAEFRTQVNKGLTSTTDGTLTKFTVRHEVSECLDIATQFAYQKNFCADARDPENYLDLGRSRYTCMKRCGQAPTYGRKVNECGCDARCKWLGDCCRDMEQMCPEYYNAEPVEYYKLLKWSSTCFNYLVIQPYDDAAFLSTPKSDTDISRNNELTEKPNIFTDLAITLSDFKVLDKKNKLIFENYLTYMAHSSKKEAFHFIPKIFNFKCPFESLKSQSYLKALQLFPLCQVTKVYDAMTRYRRPCKLNYILICRCKDEEHVAEHLHNACLGQNFSQSREYRYQLWDNQADFTMYLRDSDKRGTCKIRHETLFGTDNTLTRLDEPVTNTKMRISPVLSHLLTDEQDMIKNDTDRVMGQLLDINFMVELNNTLETRFFCFGLQSRLQDCRLDGCVEGGLLWIGHLSNGQSASRSCIVPVEARVLHQDGLSGIPLCTCLAVVSVLEDLGLWNIRLLWNQDTECSLSLESIPKSKLIPKSLVV